MENPGKKPKISMIAGIARKSRAIGKDNQLLWDIPEDLQHFKEITSGHPVIMGEKTYHSIGRPLPRRTNIVLTDNPAFQAEGVIAAASLPEAFQKAGEIDQEEVFVIGGGSVYRQALPFADRLYLTLVEGDFEADTFFPEYPEFTKIVSEEKGTNGAYAYSFVVLEKA